MASRSTNRDNLMNSLHNYQPEKANSPDKHSKRFLSIKITGQDEEEKMQAVSAALKN